MFQWYSHNYGDTCSHKMLLIFNFVSINCLSADNWRLLKNFAPIHFLVSKFHVISTITELTVLLGGKPFRGTNKIFLIDWKIIFFLVARKPFIFCLPGFSVCLKYHPRTLVWVPDREIWRPHVEQRTSWEACQDHWIKISKYSLYYITYIIIIITQKSVRAVPFSKVHWWGGAGKPELFGAVPTTTIQFCWPYPIPLSVHFKFNITLRNTLCHPLVPHFDLFNTPLPLITNNFQVPPWVTFENGIALM